MKQKRRVGSVVCACVHVLQFEWLEGLTEKGHFIQGVKETRKGGTRLIVGLTS